MAKSKTQQKGTRHSTRIAGKQPSTLEDETKNATQEVIRIVREAIDGEAAKHLLTLYQEIAERISEVLKMMIATVERATFILDEARWSGLEPRWDLLLDGSEEVDEGKIVLGIINKQNGTNFIQELDFAGTLVGMAKGGQNGTGFTQEELDVAGALVGMAKGDERGQDLAQADLIAHQTLLDLAKGDTGVHSGNVTKLSSGKTGDANEADDADAAEDADAANDADDTEEPDDPGEDSGDSDDDAPGKGGEKTEDTLPDHENITNPCPEDVWDSTFPADSINNTKTGASSVLNSSDQGVHDQKISPNLTLEGVWNSTFPTDVANTSNTRAESLPYILPNGTELKLIPLIPNFQPQNIAENADAGPSYTNTRKEVEDIDKKARIQGKAKSEKEAHALDRANGTTPVDQFVGKRKTPPDAFEDDEYPFHKYHPLDGGIDLGGDLSMGPEEVGIMHSGKVNKSNSLKRQRRS